MPLFPNRARLAALLTDKGAIPELPNRAVTDVPWMGATADADW
jgi:hypothetical protein